MRKYEYKVVPVPGSCLRATGPDKGADPVAFTVETMLNDLGVEGWEFVRSERVALRKGGFFGSREISREVMVFRRLPLMRGAAPTAWATAAEGLAGSDLVRPRRVPRDELQDATTTGKRRVGLRPETMLIDEATIAAE